MALIQWDESFSVGNLALDNQHKQLFDLVNQLHDAMAKGQAKDVLDRTLARLIDYTAGHFSAEERCMQQAKFPDLAAHRAQHEELTKQVLGFQADFRAGKIALSVHLMSFLRDWLQHHIQESDRRYSPFLTRA